MSNFEERDSAKNRMSENIDTVRAAVIRSPRRSSRSFAVAQFKYSKNTGTGLNRLPCHNSRVVYSRA